MTTNFPAEEFQNNISDADLIYSKLQWLQTLAIVFLICLNVFSTLGNLLIISVTIRFKQLHQSCNFLLAFACFNSIIHQWGLYVMAYVNFSEITYVSLKTCFYWQIVPLIGNFCGEMLPLLIGIDRSICFFLPIFYRRMDIQKHLFINVLICFLYTSLFLQQAHVFATAHSDEAVSCAVIEALGSGTLYYGHFFSCAMINITAIMCYVSIWIGLKRNSATRHNNKAFTSLAILMTTLFCGWFSVSLLRITISLILQVNPVILFYVKIYSFVCINTTCASQAYILFSFSKDYKNAVRTFLGLNRTQTIRTAITNTVKTSFELKSRP